MRTTKRIYKTVFLVFVFAALLNINSFGRETLSAEKRTLLKVVTGIHFTFKYCADKIWPGYDLSIQPYIAYMPGDFVLFINGQHAPGNFDPYPADWPDIGTKAYIHFGVYRNLIGQFAFDFEIDSLKTFAMGIPKNLLFSFENPAYMLLSSTIHEGFHQYQHNHFGEISWAREELYPILDTGNTALASLEMHILKEALRAMFNNNKKKRNILLKEFAAVRNYRWTHADGFVKKYEQGQEINEGTARYVEMKAMDCFLKPDTIKTENRLFKEIKRDMAGLTIQELLQNDINERLNGPAVAPDDMLRNRIYPVGAALGFLLDDLGLPWKMKFQAAGSEISFPGLLINHFQLDSTQLSGFFIKAKEDFNYPQIRSSAKQLIDRYFTEYRQALRDFNRQKGMRIEIHLSNNGIRRFRSTKDKKWIVENGKKLLCLHYNLYSLKSSKNKNILLELRDKAVFDQNDWKKRRRMVVFYSGKRPDIILDNSPLKAAQDTERDFNKITLTADNIKFEAEGKGSFSMKNDQIVITL